MEFEPSPSSGSVLLLDLDNPDSGARALRALKALASEPRLDILRLLAAGACNVKDIAEALDMPLSTATLHIKALEDGGMIRTELSAASRGLQKMCSRRFDSLMLRMPGLSVPGGNVVQTVIPIGTYTDCHVEPPCGLCSAAGAIGLLDDPASFFEPARVDAQLLWFSRGYIEYRLPHRLPPATRPLSLSLSLELCSEAPLHNPDWPSDITFWVNGIEIGTWTAPGDYGGSRGLLTPDWWETHQTQYGLLKQISVTEQGTFVDGMRISPVTIADLNLASDHLARLRIGVRPNAAHARGLNLFGRTFGNYPQELIFQVRYH